VVDAFFDLADTIITVRSPIRSGTDRTRGDGSAAPSKTRESPQGAAAGTGP